MTRSTVSLLGRDRLPFDVELIDVSDTGAPGPPRSQFSLVFRGGPTPPMAQGIHRLEHDRLGQLDLFLVPLGPCSPASRKPSRS